MDPLELRLQERRQDGHARCSTGRSSAHDGYAETIEALPQSSRLQDAARQEPGARRRLRLLVQRRRRIRARPCRSTPTAPSSSRPAAPTSAARAPRWRSWRPRRFGVDYDQVRADRRRHRVGRLHARDRRLARHLRDRHGGGRRHQEGDRRAVRARRDDLGRRSRRRGLGGRLRQAGRAAMSATSSRCRCKEIAAQARR